MAYVDISQEFINNFPEAMQAMDEYFDSMEELIKPNHGVRRYEIHAPGVPKDATNVLVYFKNIEGKIHIVKVK